MQLMSGTQPRRLNLMWLQRNRLPVDWQAQLAIIDGFKLGAGSLRVWGCGVALGTGIKTTFRDLS
jgi:hypothetical protein